MKRFYCTIKLFSIFAMLIFLASCAGNSTTAVPSVNQASVASSSPENHSSGVSKSTNFSVTFKKAVNAASLTDPGAAFLVEASSSAVASSKNSKQLKAVGDTVNLQLQTLSADGKNAVFRLHTGVVLNSTTTYQFTINLGIIKDSNNVPLGSGTIIVSTFTTGDVALPTATIVTPSNGATDVSATQVIQIAFNEAVQNVNSTTVTLHEDGPTGVNIAIGNIMANSNQRIYSFSPASPLAGKKSYYIVLSDGITNTNADRLKPTTFYFTTGDFTLPTVNIINPSNGAINTSVQPSIKLMFSEPVQYVNSTNVILHQGSPDGASISGTITSAAGNIYTFNPDTTLKGQTTFYLTLSNGITDMDNNVLTPTVFHFTTGIGFIAVGSGQIILTSSDGITPWTIQHPATTDVMAGVTTSSSARLYVAVGSIANTPSALTSPDGIVWTPRAVPNLSGAGYNITSLDAVAASSAGKLVAIAAHGSIVTSDDNGVTWIKRVSGTTNDLLGVTVSPAGLFVIVGDAGTILISTDGINWANHSITTIPLSGVTVKASGSSVLFVAVGESSNGPIYTSLDGINWVPHVSGIGAAGGLLGVTVSPNGLFVAVGSNDGTTGAIITSSDGINWTQSTGAASILYGATVNHSGFFVVVGDSGTILTSPDGINWAARVSGTNLLLNGVTAGY